MSIFYGTDKQKLTNAYEALSDEDGFEVETNVFPWLEHYQAISESNVTDAHFRRYLTESAHYSERDAVMFDLYKQGVLSVRRVDGSTAYESEDLDVESDTIVYRYELRTKSQKAKEQIKNLIISAVKKDEPYSEDAVKKAVADTRKHLNAYEVAGIDEALDGVEAELEAGARSRIDADVQKRELDDAVKNASASSAESAERVMTGLKGAIYAHRSHSPFYAIFHPINYYREAQSIAGAKEALVKLGASAEKVDEFERNVIAEDRALRKDKDPERAAELREKIATTPEQLSPEPEQPAVDTASVAAAPEEDDLEDDLAFYDELEKDTDLTKEKENRREMAEPVISNPETNLNNNKDGVGLSNP